jgi:hypothetical protein
LAASVAARRHGTVLHTYVHTQIANRTSRSSLQAVRPRSRPNVESRPSIQNVKGREEESRLSTYTGTPEFETGPVPVAASGTARPGHGRKDAAWEGRHRRERRPAIESARRADSESKTRQRSRGEDPFFVN